MLYLIKSNNYLKIGYAKDVDKRMEAYSTHNPNFELLDVVEGTLDDEKYLHNLCKEYQYRTEWFNFDKEIINIWNRFKQDIIVSKIPDNIDSKYKKILSEINGKDKWFREMIKFKDKHILKGKDAYFYYKS